MVEAFYSTADEKYIPAVFSSQVSDHLVYSNFLLIETFFPKRKRDSQKGKRNKGEKKREDAMPME